MAKTKADYEDMGRKAKQAGHADHQSLTPGSWQEAAFKRGYSEQTPEAKGVGTVTPVKLASAVEAYRAQPVTNWPAPVSSHVAKLYAEMYRCAPDSRRSQRMGAAIARMIKRHGEPQRSA